MSAKKTATASKTFHHFSRKFSLERLNPRTVENCLARAEQIQKLIDGGLIPKKYLKMAQARVSNFRTSAKEVAAKAEHQAKLENRRVTAAMKKKAREVLAEQAAQAEAPVAAPAAEGQVA